MSGEIAWINGPFQAGEYSDLRIFREGGLQSAIDFGERVEADDGYRGDPTTLRVPADVLTRQRKPTKCKKRFRAVMKRSMLE